jgi:hypothetical protein
MAKLSYEQRGRATRLAWDKRVTRATMLSWNLCTEEEARCEVCGVCEDTEHIAMRCRKIGRCKKRHDGREQLEYQLEKIADPARKRGLGMAVREELEGQDVMSLWHGCPTQRQMEKFNGGMNMTTTVGILADILRPLAWTLLQLFEDIAPQRGKQGQATALQGVMGRRERVDQDLEQESWWRRCKRQKKIKVNRYEEDLEEYNYITSVEHVGRVVTVRGRGDRFFEAIARARGEWGPWVTNWRKGVVDHIRNNWDHYLRIDITLVGRLGDVAQAGACITPTEIQAAADMLNAEISIWHFKGVP